MRAVLLVVLLAAKVRAQDCTVTDATPAFWEYWAQAEGKERIEQVRLFHEMVIARHPKLYGDAVLLRPPDYPVDRLIHGFLDSAPIGEMRRLSGILQRDLPEYLRSLRADFPRFACDVPVYLMVSIGGFDGAVRTLNGKRSLLFGIDVIARIHGAADMQAFLDHELFHVYHGQAQPKLGDNVLAGLWREGLATYVSHVRHPEVPESHILGMPRDLAEKTRPLLGRLAAELLLHLDSTEPDVYRRFFLGGSADESAFPTRSGYYAGFLLAHEISKNATLDQMARMDAAALRAAVLPVLKKWAAEQSRTP